MVVAWQKVQNGAPHLVGHGEKSHRAASFCKGFENLFCWATLLPEGCKELPPPVQILHMEWEPHLHYWAIFSFSWGSSSWQSMIPIFQPCCGSHCASHHCSPLLLQVCSFTLLSTSFIFRVGMARIENSLGEFNHCQAPHCHLYLSGNSQEQALYITNPFNFF